MIDHDLFSDKKKVNINVYHIKIIMNVIFLIGIRFKIISFIMLQQYKFYYHQGQYTE